MRDPSKLTPAQKRLLLLGKLRLVILLFFWAAFLVSTFLLNGQWPPVARVVIALAPALPLTLVIWTYATLVRRGCFDEFGRRVLVEAAATVFIVGMPLLLLYAMAYNADIGFPELNWRGVTMAAMLLFGFGVMRGLKRHQGRLTLGRGGAS
jgi:hypothetical protein